MRHPWRTRAGLPHRPPARPPTRKGQAVEQLAHDGHGQHDAGVDVVARILADALRGGRGGSGQGRDQLLSVHDLVTCSRVCRAEPSDERGRCVQRAGRQHVQRSPPRRARGWRHSGGRRGPAAKGTPPPCLVWVVQGRWVQLEGIIRVVPKVAAAVREGGSGTPGITHQGQHNQASSITPRARAALRHARHEHAYAWSPAPDHVLGKPLAPGHRQAAVNVVCHSKEWSRNDDDLRTGNMKHEGSVVRASGRTSAAVWAGRRANWRSLDELAAKQAQVVH